jgi:hypothetical protein
MHFSISSTVPCGIIPQQEAAAATAAAEQQQRRLRRRREEDKELFPLLYFSSDTIAYSLRWVKVNKNMILF